MLKISKYRKTILGCSAIFTASIASFTPSVSANQTNRLTVNPNSPTIPQSGGYINGKKLLIAQITNNSNASGFNVSHPIGGTTGINAGGNPGGGNPGGGNPGGGNPGGGNPGGGNPGGGNPGGGNPGGGNPGGGNPGGGNPGGGNPGGGNPGGGNPGGGNPGGNNSNASGLNVTSPIGGTTGINAGNNITGGNGTTNPNGIGGNNNSIRATGVNNNKGDGTGSGVASRFNTALGNYEQAAAVLAQEQAAQTNTSSAAPVRYSRQAGDLADCGCLNNDTVGTKVGRPELAAAKAAEAEAAAELAKAKAEARQFLESVKNEPPTASVPKVSSPLW
jgi:hypothetical protein